MATPDANSVLHVEQWPVADEGDEAWAAMVSWYVRTSWGGFILFDVAMISSDRNGHVSRLYDKGEAGNPDAALADQLAIGWRGSLERRAPLSGADLPPDFGHSRPIGLSSGAHATVSTVFALMNCRNVQLDDSTPSRQQRRAAERSNRPMPFTVRSLLVRPIATRRSPETSAVSDAPVALALHWVRGHFKHYDDANKLFGRHTGTYWWAPHLAGEAAAGVVVKDYRLPEGPASD
jgi:hypothetical protein